MESELRVGLYNGRLPAGRSVSFNPLEPEPFDIVDLSIDVSNFSRIYHLRTLCVREALEGAALVVTDSEPLANIVRQAVSGARVSALLFGDTNWSYNPQKEATPIIGLLNHSAETEMNNIFALPLLNELDRALYLYGQSLTGLEVEQRATADFGEFCSKVDILLLPSLPGAINSPTVAMAAMAKAGVIILAHNAPGYYSLDGSTGVQLLPYNTADWSVALALHEHRTNRLTAMQERNRVFAIRQNRESFNMLDVLLNQPVAKRRPLSKGCNCAEKK